MKSILIWTLATMADSAPLLDKPATLASLRTGESGVIASVQVAPELAPRLAALGFQVGHVVQVIRRAPFAGPLHLRIGTTDVIMRRHDAASITITA